MKLFNILLLLLFTTLSFAQKSDLSPEVIASIEKRIEVGLIPSVAIGIIDKDGPRYYSFGTKTTGGSKVNEHTIYEIGSISKTFTATMLAQMVLDGKMKLDDPIEMYLPSDVRVPSYNGVKITLGHLSDHTSSLPRLPSNMTVADPSNPYADYTVDQMMAFLSSYELTREIGSEYEYSNYAQGLLGYILATQAKKSYEEMMIDMIAKPLGMNETKITFDEKMKKNLAIGHDRGIEVSNWDLPALAGAGAIRSSVHDMLIYLGANLGLIKTPLNAAMNLTHVERHNKTEDGGVGLAWHAVSSPNGEKFLAHNGGTGGYRTFSAFSETQGKGVVVLTNSTEGADDIGQHLLYPEAKLRMIKPLFATEVRKAMEEKGVEDAVALFDDLNKNHRDEYDFNEQDMNGLGYYYMSLKNYEAAKAIFKMNVEVFPESSNVYDSYGEALMSNGEHEMAIANYKKSIELDPSNMGAVDMLAKMGVEYEVEKIEVPAEILAQYVGKYELQPSFHINITTEGNQIFLQATGQGKFEMFPKSEKEFYLKVVAARIVFSKNEQGEVESLTLFQ